MMMISKQIQNSHNYRLHRIVAKGGPLPVSRALDQKDDQMKSTLIATGILIVFDALCLFFYLPPMITEGMLPYIATFLVIALVVFVVGKVITVMLLKKKQVQLNITTSSSGGILTNKQFIFSVV